MPQLLETRHKLPPLNALTALRLIAALYVAVYHLNLQATLRACPPLANFIASGYNGVTFFFVLSGFILAYNYGQVYDRTEFWVARFARIYPIYFLTCCFGALRPSQLHRPDIWPATLAAFLMVQTLWLPFAGALNQYGWTLSVEAVFYLLFPFLLPRVQRIRHHVFLQLQSLYLFLVCTPLLLVWLHKMEAANLWAGLLESHSPLAHMNAFFVGMYFGIAQASMSPNRIPQTQAVQDRCHPSIKRTRMLFASLISAGVLLSISLPQTAMPLRTSLLTYAFAAIIVALAEQDWPALAHRYWQIGGEISYGIYILQFPVIFTTYTVMQHLRPGIRPPLLLILFFLILSAYLSFRWFETPVRLALRGALTQKPVATRRI